MGFISQKKEKQLRLRYTVAFFLFCLFLHILNSMTLGPLSLSAHTELHDPRAMVGGRAQECPGSLSPLCSELHTSSCLSGLPYLLSASPPQRLQGAAVEAPTQPGSGPGPWALWGGPRPRPVPPTVRLMDWLSFFPRGSVPSFSPRPWSGPPLVWLAQLAGRDPLVMHLRWGVALPWNPRPTLSVQDDFLQLMERIPHVREHSRCAFQASVLTASVSGAFVGNERMASCLLASSWELCPRP